MPNTASHTHGHVHDPCSHTTKQGDIHKIRYDDMASQDSEVGGPPHLKCGLCSRVPIEVPPFPLPSATLVLPLLSVPVNDFIKQVMAGAGWYEKCRGEADIYVYICTCVFLN
jgi:hypothetical protein